MKDHPYHDLGFAKVDLHRKIRRGFPEVILAKGKSPSQIASIAEILRSKGQPVVITKLHPASFPEVARRLPWLTVFPKAQMAAGPVSVLRRSVKRNGFVLVVTAGTSDIPVAEEAVVTLKLMRMETKTLFDVGVAGLHRLLKHRRLLTRARVIVVMAGMDGALPSVVSGLVGVPVIAVPTSIGYGASFRGIAPLLAMLNSCSPGVAVVNIDNGFGAGYLAAIMAGKKAS